MIKKIDILTLFPQVLEPYLQESILKRAQTNKLINIRTHNIRDFSEDKHHSVDDIPYGGSTGMVLQVDPVRKCIDSVKTKNSHIVLLCPAGKQLNTKRLNILSQYQHLILVCGHYEGIDHRINNYIDESISIGDYVLTGGSLPALVITDALVRLIPGVLGNTNSLINDSFYDGLLDWNVYTRPQTYDKISVPEVLTSGNHKKIDTWKRKSALINTFIARPDLFAQYPLSKEDQKIFIDFLNEEVST